MERHSGLPVNPPACLTNGWRRLTLHYMNNAQAEPLHPAHAVFIFARLRHPHPWPMAEVALATAVTRALPALAHNYRTYRYDASQLMVADGRIIPTACPAHNVRLLPDPAAPAEWEPFVVYCMAHVPRFHEPLCLRYTPNGYLHLCFSHALVDGLEMVAFMERLAGELAAVGQPLAAMPPQTITPAGEYTFFHEFWDLGPEAAASLYHRTVYEMGVRWQAAHINQLVAGDVPERKVSLAAVRHTADWPTFLGHNRAAVARAKRWQNRFGWWSTVLGRGYRWPLALYDGAAHAGWARPWTTGDLQVSAMRMAEPLYLIFPVRHPAQGRAAVVGAGGVAAGRPWVQVSGVVRKKPSRSG